MFDALIPRSKLPTCVPGIGSWTVPSPVKSVRKISPRPRFVLGTTNEVESGLQKCPMRLNWNPPGKSVYPPKESWWVRSSTEGPKYRPGLALSSAPTPKSWSDAIALTGPVPPVFSKRDNAYEIWKFSARTWRNGRCTFCVSLVCNPLYTERPMGLKKGSGGALALTPAKAHEYPNSTPQGWSKSAE